MHQARILIVDDDARMLESTRLLLQKPDYSISTASSGAEAFQMVGPGQYDLILLDLFLGDATGFEVMKLAREVCPESLVVMITGAASVQTAVEALRKGAYSYLSKPYEPEELTNTVQNALTQKKLESKSKEALEALRGSEKQFRHLVVSLPIGIVIIQDHLVAYLNQQAESLLAPLLENGVPRDWDWLHPEDREAASSAYQQLCQGGISVWEIQVRAYLDKADQDRKSSPRWLQCRANTFDYRGRPAILFGLSDITRAKETEQMLLIKSKMHSLGRVAAGIAHEIRNPLTGINGFLFSLRNLAEAMDPGSSDVEKMLPMLRNIQSASDKIEHVIRRVLDFAKPGRPQMERVNLNDVVQEAVSLSSASVRKNGIGLTVELEDNLSACRADRQLIEQVVLNLVDNAVQSLEEVEGRKRIEVSTFSRPGRIGIVVSDSGPGVPEELRAEIYDPFFTTRANGSGIGLSLAQRILTDHGGAIRVETSRLGGAEFRIDLPSLKES